MATVHLISGLPSAGKTTYSIALKAATDGVHLRLDHWLVTAYGEYAIDAIGHQEHVRRVGACRALIWGVAQQFLRRQVDVILDDGFFLHAHRLRYAQLAAAMDADCTIHFLNTPRAIIEARLEERNRNLPPDSFIITPARLEQFYAMFEPPSPVDGLRIIEIDDCPNDCSYKGCGEGGNRAFINDSSCLHKDANAVEH